MTGSAKRGFRAALYAAGILLTALGIVLCKRCDWGISPVSCVPFVLEEITGLSFGTTTVLFHAVNIALQMILRKHAGELQIWLQFLFAVAFGWAVDLCQLFIPPIVSVWAKVICLVASAALTALGIFFTAQTNIVQDPTVGMVRELSRCTGVTLDRMKNIYDLAMLVMAALMGLAFLRRITGIGIATLVSALRVGRMMALWKRLIRLDFSGSA